MQRWRLGNRWSTSWSRHSLWTTEHWLRFSRFLELLPQGRNDDGEVVRNETQPHAINHWLNSCPSAIPAGLEAAGYKPPCWHVKKEHSTRQNGFASVRECYDWMLTEERPLRAESRDQGLKQHYRWTFLAGECHA